jgi:exopolysaccharide biosynthesis predicted pyruvyltransferase EpsI
MTAFSVARCVGRHELIADLQRTTEDVLRPHIPADKPIALLDYPAYANVGDSAIWLGALQWLRTWGLPAPCYVSDMHSFAPGELARRIGHGTILLSGGGNFGDLYEHHQQFRERVIAEFPHCRIVQLPQTIQFRSTAALRRAKAVFDGHRDVTILVRDQRSYELAANTFRARVELCPDLAFGLGAMQRTAQPLITELRLLRSDQESAADTPTSGADWPVREPSTFMGAAQPRLRRLHRTRPSRAVAAVLERTYTPLARQRLARGIALLSGAERVVTDRLHGHILCVLLGVPHRLLADRHGKVSAFAAQWTSHCDLVDCEEWIA